MNSTIKLNRRLPFAEFFGKGKIVYAQNGNGFDAEGNFVHQVDAAGDKVIGGDQPVDPAMNAIRMKAIDLGITVNKKSTKQSLLAKIAEKELAAAEAAAEAQAASDRDDDGDDDEENSARTELEDAATFLGIDFTDETPDAELAILIEEEKAKQ